MNVFKRKTRMVSFRLSEEEYARLHEASVSRGARSVSDFARDSLVHSLAPDPQIRKLASDFESLNRDVQALRSMVAPSSAEE